MSLEAGQYVKATDATHVDTDGVKRYVALLTQTGSAAPVATVLENSLGGSVVWTRAATGLYTGTLSGAFTADKTAVFLTMGIQSGYAGGATRADANTVNVRSFLTDLASGADDALTGATLEIRVYP